MLLILAFSAFLFISWLLYISLAQPSAVHSSTSKNSDPIRDTHNKLDHINAILGMEATPEQEE